MNRPLLQKALLVAGVIGAGIAVWFWLSPIRQPVEATTAKAACPSPAQIGAAVKTVGGISSPDGRDSAYASLVREALCNLDFDAAHAISRQISSPTARDEAYMAIVEDAMRLQDVGSANRASASISSPPARDRAKSMIINGIRPPAS
jgi:hypothetical protein